MIAPSATAPKSFRQTIGLGPSSVSASSGTTALLVIDAQGSYAPEGGLAISGVDEAQKEIAGAVAKYRQVSREQRRRREEALTDPMSSGWSSRHLGPAQRW